MISYTTLLSRPSVASIHLLNFIINLLQVTPLTWLEAWLDNMMASVPELAICYIKMVLFKELLLFHTSARHVSNVYLNEFLTFVWIINKIAKLSVFYVTCLIIILCVLCCILSHESYSKDFVLTFCI